MIFNGSPTTRRATDVQKAFDRSNKIKMIEKKNSNASSVLMNVIILYVKEV
jgi:hypothetical protein